MAINPLGLKQGIINAKIEAAKVDSPTAQADSGKGSSIEVEAEIIKEAIVNFLTEAEFRVTKLNAPVVVETLKTPDQAVDVEQQTLLGDKAPILDAIKKIPGGAALIKPLESALKQAIKPLLKGGSTLPGLDLGKDDGGLEGAGYVYIGEDPDSREGFDVEDEDGQRVYTTVKLFREDIEGLL